MLSVAIVGCRGKDSDESTLATDSVPTLEQPSDTIAAKSPMIATMDTMMVRIHRMPKSGNADHDLAAAMEIHHQSAIDMASLLLQSGTDQQLKAIAAKIIEAQSKEIEVLKKIQKQYAKGEKTYDPAVVNDGLGKAMTEDMNTMMKMPEKIGSSVDSQFASTMVKHHRDGIQMGHTILLYVKDPIFKELTRNMVSSQELEIDEMEDWLSKHADL
jgi:uncharacterized protein (DUF305 family)